jgi:hypothetical protein
MSRGEFVGSVVVIEKILKDEIVDEYINSPYDLYTPFIDSIYAYITRQGIILSFDNLLKITSELYKVFKKKQRIFTDYLDLTKTETIFEHLLDYDKWNHDWILNTPGKFQRYCRVIANIDKVCFPGAINFDEKMKDLGGFKEEMRELGLDFCHALIYLVLNNCDHENPDFKLLKHTIFSICAMKIEQDTKVKGMTLNSSIESLELPFVIKGREREGVQNYETDFYQALENLQFREVDFDYKDYKFKSVDIFVNHVNLDNEIVNDLKYSNEIFPEMFRQKDKAEELMYVLTDAGETDLETTLQEINKMRIEDKEEEEGLKAINEWQRSLHSGEFDRIAKEKRDQEKWEKEVDDYYRMRRMRRGLKRPRDEDKEHRDDTFESFFAYFC